MTGTKAAANEGVQQLRNARVKTLRAHSNQYGDKFEKPKGSSYIHPRPAADIATGVVEAEGEAASTTKKASRKKP